MKRRDLLGAALLAAGLGLTAGCDSDLTTDFNSGITPLEPVTAPAPMGSERFPETANTTTGESQDFEWAHLRGYVRAPLARVYEAMRDAAVVTDRRRVAEFMTTPNVEPQYPVSFRVHNIVRDIITLEFDQTWRLGPLEGSLEAPTAVVAVYQKTFGTSFISLLRGSIVARSVDANTTEVHMVRHIESSGAGAADAEIYLRDCYGSIVARVHGRALPTY